MTAFADDDLNEAEGQFYRPPAPSTTRVKKPQENSSERKGARRPANRADGDPELEEDGFLRARRRVPVRRGLIPPSRTGRILASLAVVCAFGVLFLLAVSIRNFFRDDPRFRVAAASSIQILGNSQVTRPELLTVFGSDLGRNIFFIPLEERRVALEKLPWVEHATVMRLLPDQLRVSVIERTPVAFVRRGNSVGLVDEHGVLLQAPAKVMAAKHYSFPVVSGISAADPLPVRAARMRLFEQFVHDLDGGGTKVSSQLSEVDIADPNDVSALLPAEGTDVLVHFGESDFLARYHSFQQHLPEWRQQYPHLASVDMRYENQVVLEMTPQAAALSAQPKPTGQKPSAQKPAAPKSSASKSAAGSMQHHAPPVKHAAKPAAKPAAKAGKSSKAEKVKNR